ncbi:MAG: DUF5615 family PIN-like protein [candidate division WOR-3 bacterium]|nr:DUF5615 family PIN-like protein [candidate division WOR-3 bacterium]
MSLRFFANHCISNAIIEHLRSHGHEVLRLREHIDHDSPDSRVIDKAQQLDVILVSLNGDFADIVTYPPARYRGITALDVHDHPEGYPRSSAGCRRTSHSTPSLRITEASYSWSSHTESAFGNDGAEQPLASVLPSALRPANWELQTRAIGCAHLTPHLGGTTLLLVLDKNRWRACLLPDNYQRKLRQVPVERLGDNPEVPAQRRLNSLTAGLSEVPAA